MKKVAVLLALVLASAALVACGDDDGTTTTDTGGEANGAATGSTLAFEADPGGGLAYTTDQATAEAGETTLEFDNPQPVTHDVAIEDSKGKTVGKSDLIAESTTSTTVNLKPGKYVFYCSVPGHREGGMEGTLTVK